jgi:2-dehydro-3-deoxy-D-gluconate 5-dehydrogenase
LTLLEIHSRLKINSIPSINLEQRSKPNRAIQDFHQGCYTRAMTKLNMPNFQLEQRVALVTGAGSGLGQGFATALAAYGADVVITELPGRLTMAEPTLELIRAHGRRAMALELDVCDVPSCTRIVEQVIAEFGRVDILVNNAGVNRVQWAEDVTEENWDLVLDTDLKGAFFMSQAVGRHMITRAKAGDPGGRIINIASQMGVVGYYQRAAYGSAKAGLVNQTRVLAFEWAKHGITVNAIAPTFVRTPLTEQTFAQPEIKADLESRIPMGRIATVDDMLGAVIFLASSAASMVTGHTLLVDGGWTAV